MVKQVLDEAISPNHKKKLSQKEGIKANAVAVSKNRMMGLIKKMEAKSKNNHGLHC
jgi:hypothetical protein